MFVPGPVDDAEEDGEAQGLHDALLGPTTVRPPTDLHSERGERHHRHLCEGSTVRHAELVFQNLKQILLRRLLVEES